MPPQPELLSQQRIAGGPPSAETISRELLPLGQYKWPSLPSDESVRQIMTRLLALVRRKEKPPFIADSDLHSAKLRLLNRVVAPPAYGPHLQELDAHISNWKPSAAGAPIKAIITPPCDDTSVVHVWAGTKNLTVISPPSREELLSRLPSAFSLPSTGLLVVPTLERWFLRCEGGLRWVRHLLTWLDQREGPTVVGCNSWAWSFLRKAVGIDCVITDAVTFQAFDAQALLQWLSRLSQADPAARGTRFLFAKSGEDVFQNEDDGSIGFFRTLAAHSLGIPWVAWHVWRCNLYTGQEQVQAPGDVNAPDSEDLEHLETLWIEALQELSLPSSHDESALFVLHALLMHGELKREELDKVVPIVGETYVASSLLSSGFLEQEGDNLRCRAAAYPAIRSALKSAGFPMDKL